MIATTMVMIAAAILVLLVFSAFFSGSETALTASSRARIHQLEQRGSANAHKVNQLLEARDRLIGAILIGNNLVNILASSLATSLFLSVFGQSGVVWSTLVMTVLVVIFAEILPKTYAINHPDRAALTVAPVLKPVVDLLSPLARAAEFIVRRLIAAIAGSSEGHYAFSAHDELRGQIALHHQEGAVVKRDRDMLGGILDLRDLQVAEVMVHRTGMNMIDIDEPVEKIVDGVLSSGHTRLPVWREEPDNIIGMLHAKELLRALAAARGDASAINIGQLITKPWFVPDTTSLTDQLNAFLRKKAHIAIVVDEYGEVMGLATLEDILEVIVGDISDEHDVAVEGVRKQPSGTVNVDGSVPIRELNRAMDWSLPDEEATTIAGLVIHEAQAIPEIGQVFTFYGYRFEVLRRERHRITALRISPLAKQPERREAAE